MAESSFSGPGPVPIARSVVTPAARARSSMASRSSANCGKSICACESINSIAYDVELWQPQGTISRALLESGTNFHVLVRESCEDRPAIRSDRRRNNHAVGLDAAQLARREIHNHGNLAANQLFRFVVLCDARANLPNLRADVYGKFQQLIRAHDAFRRFDLPDAHLDFRKIFDVDFLRRRLRRRGVSRGSRTRSRFCSRRGRCWVQFFVCHRFHPFYRFAFVDAGKQRLYRAQLLSWRQLAPAKPVQFNGLNRTWQPEQRPHFCRAGWQYRMREHGHDTQQLRRSPQNRGFPRLPFRGVPECPGLLPGEVLVRRADHAPNRLERTRKTQILIAFERLANRRLDPVRQRLILGTRIRGFKNCAAEVFLNERPGTAREIAETIGKVAVIARHERVITEIAILPKDHFA